MNRLAVTTILSVTVLLASACGSAADVSTGAASDTPGTAADLPDGLLRCEDVPTLSGTKPGTLGARSNADDLLMGVIYTYAQENLDTYAGRWIDRENDGLVVVAFTDDPQPHTTELLARGPKETDLVGIEPPPPITDDRTLAERDDFAFEVVQATHTEADLMAAQRNADALFGVEGAGVSGSGISTTQNITELYLIAPTPDGLAQVAEAIAGQPVCVDIFLPPTPPSGPLDVASADGTRSPLPSGLSDVRWELDPAFPSPTATDTEVHVLATEVGCASSRDMGDALRGPQVVETDAEVIIAFAVETPTGDQNCPGNPSTPVTVTLSSPLGTRELRDAMDPTPQPVMGEADVPTVDQPEGGDGWQVLSSTLFIDAWNGPLAATSLDDFWLMSDTFWEADLRPDEIDFDTQVVVALTIPRKLDTDSKCGPHVLDNPIVRDGTLTYDLDSPLDDGSPCIDPGAHQVFVLVLDRDALPDSFTVPDRGADLVVAVR